MIAKITGGQNTGKLVAYLYGPGKTNEHTDPHLVASWDGFAPDPGRSPDFNATKKQLVRALDLRVEQAGDRAPKRHVWHCSLRAAPEDRLLSDQEWADIARRVVHATGIAPDGDPDGCRWVAVRHAEDHIHIAATKVRGDLRPARHWNDYLTADEELVSIEKEYGLRQVARGDRTAAQRPTRAEQEKAHRAGHQATARERLRVAVRTALSVATTPEEFLSILAGTGSVLIEVQRFPSGDIRGYKVALDGDTNASGEPVWFSGSKLAPDLSFPKIRERLTAAEEGPKGLRSPETWHQATTAVERVSYRLDQVSDAAAQAHLVAFGEALDILPLVAPQDIRPQLRQAALAFERATRSRIRAEHHHARSLRRAIRGLRTEPCGWRRRRARDAPRRRAPHRDRCDPLARTPTPRPAGRQRAPNPRSPSSRIHPSRRGAPDSARPPQATTADDRTNHLADTRARTRPRPADPRRPRLEFSGRRARRRRGSRSPAGTNPPTSPWPEEPGGCTIGRRGAHLARASPHQESGSTRAAPTVSPTCTSASRHRRHSAETPMTAGTRCPELAGQPSL